MIPPVSPFLWASQRTPRRRDAQRIENGMKRAVMLVERADTGKSGRGRHCFTRSIKNVGRSLASYQKIEADLRKAEKTIAQSQKYLTMWRLNRWI
ncbi:Domain of uncharacterised function (DUF3560) [Escherichia coli]|uniref:Domain of uncharacterized function (DUF3560) n=1 Tax=Escherichia coli TaxID=562 RepID=A0A376ZWP0_ECOLX|nr:Domain of uncharacterised function (DUF3560) [Escherichia coli]